MGLVCKKMLRRYLHGSQVCRLVAEYLFNNNEFVLINYILLVYSLLLLRHQTTD